MDPDQGRGEIESARGPRPKGVLRARVPGQLSAPAKPVGPGPTRTRPPSCFRGVGRAPCPRFAVARSWMASPAGPHAGGRFAAETLQLVLRTNTHASEHDHVP